MSFILQPVPCEEGSLGLGDFLVCKNLRLLFGTLGRVDKVTIATYTGTII